MMPTPARRSGFTLIEVVVSMLILGIICGAAVKMLTKQTHSFDLQTNLRAARSISRSSTNVLESDLRMVQDSGGVDSVTADGKLVRIFVPYRFGLVCATSGNTTTVSMLPADSGIVALSVYAGFAWRNSATGRYTYIAPANPTTTDAPIVSTNPALCTGSAVGDAQIQTVSNGGRTGDILDITSPAPSGATVGAPVFFWQRIIYSFRTSNMYPSQIGLWRNVQGGLNEELMAPFDTSARFRFYQAGDDTSRSIPPAVSAIRGIDLVLMSLSPRATSDNPTPSKSKLVTSVFFKNVRAF